MEKNCIKCKELIHPKRLEILPNCNTCVNCSNAQKKSAISVVKGVGEDTWNETIVMDSNEYKKYLEAEAKLKKINIPPSSFTE